MSDKRYLQRELSWNRFNARVLHEGLREDNLLLDRLKFLAITGSNYDEFFMVRVARLMRDAADGDRTYPGIKEKPSAILTRLLTDIRRVVEELDRTFTLDILPQLAAAGLRIVRPDEWTAEVNRRVDRIFDEELMSLATPLAVRSDADLDSMVTRNRIYVAFLLADDELTIIRMPDNVDRFRDFRAGDDQREIILLEDVMRTRGRLLFGGKEIRASCLFRITRDADMTVDEEQDEDFIAAMEEILESRKSGFPVRLETHGDELLAGRLRTAVNLSEAHHFHMASPLDMKGFFKLVGLSGFDHLRSPHHVPMPPEDLPDTDDLWDILHDRDVMLHHPYESYLPVVRMVEMAADDPRTLAIKMTLYRTSGDSPIVRALIRAAERGVQVTVLVELKARFDEFANIKWASRLAKAGAIVVYGLAVLKVHGKALMVVRREDEGIRRYVHLGTGNYNDTTARLYTDIGLMTGREEYTRDVALLFNAITGYSSEPHLETLSMAPFTLRKTTLGLIRREEKRARGGEEARIIAKMNSLVDEEIIEALYEASCAGVVIDLNVRGMCSLRPGVKGMSENIRVVSIIDGFLEHTRAFLYHNGGQQDIYLSSADWMGRNLDRRVELLIPVPDPAHKLRIRGILESYFRDNCRSWQLQPNGDWAARHPGKQESVFRVQEHFMQKVAADAASRVHEERKALIVRRVPPGDR